LFVLHMFSGIQGCFPNIIRCIFCFLLLLAFCFFNKHGGETPSIFYFVHVFFYFLYVCSSIHPLPWYASSSLGLVPIVFLIFFSIQEWLREAFLMLDSFSKSWFSRRWWLLFASSSVACSMCSFTTSWS